MLILRCNTECNRVQFVESVRMIGAATHQNAFTHTDLGMAELDEKDLDDLLEDTLGEFSDEISAHPGLNIYTKRGVQQER